MANQKGTIAAWCCLLLMVCQATAWVALRVHVRNPQFGGCVFDPGSNSLVYFQNLAKGIGADKVDLDTGRMEATSLAQTTLLTTPMGNGERLRFHTSVAGILIGFEIFNEKTGKRLIETELPEQLNRPVIVGNRYLVACELTGGKFSGLKVVDAYANEKVARVKSLSSSELPPGLYSGILQPLQGTSQFAVGLHLKSPGANQAAQDFVVIFGIEDGVASEVARWATGSKPASVLEYDRKLFSLSLDGKQVEIRELPSLQLIESRPLPDKLAGKWSRIHVQEGIGKFDNSQTGKDEFFRLPDFERVEIPPEFQFLSFKSLCEDATQQVLLAHRTSRNVEYIVVDPDHRTIVFRRTASLTSSAAVLDDHRLGICDLTSGISVDVIDLPSGNIIKTFRPYAWLDWWIPILALGSAISCVAWIHKAPRASLPANVSILVLSTLLGGVSLFACIHYGSAWQVQRPCVCYLFTVLACTTFISGWNLALGAAHWSRRWLVLIVSLSVVLQTITFLHLHDDEIPRFVPVLALLTMVLPALVITTLLWIARLGGLSWEREQRAGSSETRQPQRIALTDYFWLTAAAGLLIMSLAPFRTGLWNYDSLFDFRVLPGLLFLSLFAFLNFPMALVTMSRSHFAQRTMFVLMIASAIWIVADGTLLFWYSPYHSPFLDLTIFRMAATIVFCSYLCFTAWRLEGWKLIWRGHGSKHAEK